MSAWYLGLRQSLCNLKVSSWDSVLRVKVTCKLSASHRLRVAHMFLAGFAELYANVRVIGGVSAASPLVDKGFYAGVVGGDVMVEQVAQFGLDTGSSCVAASHGGLVEEFLASLGDLLSVLDPARDAHIGAFFLASGFLAHLHLVFGSACHGFAPFTGLLPLTNDCLGQKRSGGDHWKISRCCRLEFDCAGVVSIMRLGELIVPGEGMTRNDSAETFWGAQCVLLTGGAGFLGSYVEESLQARGCGDIVIPRSAEWDLRDAGAVERLYAETKPTMVIHLAAVCGGIGANRARPGTFFYDNLMMGVQVQEFARRAGVRKFVGVGTICAYPKHTPVPFREELLWDGYPEETNAPYGLAKKMLLVQSQAYRAQYGMNAIHLLPVNLYGPRDNFHPDSSHVIPAIIKKCYDAMLSGEDHIVCWGDGSPTREFLFAKDAAEGVVLAAERYDEGAPMNLGSGMEISIRKLTEKIVAFMGGDLRIAWDREKPNGQPRRCLDISRAEKAVGFRARTAFDAGLRETIAWYIGERQAGREH